MISPEKAFEVLLEVFKEQGGCGLVCAKMPDGTVVEITIQSHADAEEEHAISKKNREALEAELSETRMNLKKAIGSQDSLVAGLTVQRDAAIESRDLWKSRAERARVDAINIAVIGWREDIDAAEEVIMEAKAKLEEAKSHANTAGYGASIHASDSAICDSARRAADACESGLRTIAAWEAKHD